MERVRVVGAAMLRTDPVTGRRNVLAGRRREPPRLAGLWEFPGGKVEAGESDRQALLRELDEELAVSAEIGDRVGPAVPIGETAVLVVHLATTSDEPRLLDHDEHRWLAHDELDDVPWIPVDEPILAELRLLLRAGPVPPMP